MWIIFSETINILRKLQKSKIFGIPKNFYLGFMYIGPSSGHSLLNFNLQNYLKDWWKFIHIHGYCTMALRSILTLPFHGLSMFQSGFGSIFIVFLKKILMKRRPWWKVADPGINIVKKHIVSWMIQFWIWNPEGGYSDLVPTGVCRWSRQTCTHL